MAKAGWVTKMGGKVQTWKTRWMVFQADAHQLAYYKDQRMKEQKGTINIKEVTFVKATDDPKLKKPNVFIVGTPDRDYYISTASISETQSWITIIEAHVRKYFPTKLSATVDALTSPRQRPNMRTGMRTSVSLANFNLAALENDESFTLNEKPADVSDPNTPAQWAQQPNDENPRRLRRTTSSGALALVSGAASTAVEPAKTMKRQLSSGNLGKRLNRSISKNMTYLRKSKEIGKLYVSVVEAVFTSDPDKDSKPMVVAYFERQEIESAISKDYVNPKWKDSFLFSVLNIESRLKLTICNESRDKEIDHLKIPIKFLQDGKQRRDWYDFKSGNGRIMLSWRFESLGEEDEDGEEEGDVLGTLQINVLSARGLLERPGGALRNPQIEISYSKRKCRTEIIQNSLNPEWNFGVSLDVRQANLTCVLRVIDVDKVSRTHLGSIYVTNGMMSVAAHSPTPIVRWLPLQSHDDPDREFVGGELHLRFHYKHNPDAHPESRLFKSASTAPLPSDLSSLPQPSPRRRTSLGSSREDVISDDDIIASLPIDFPRPPPRVGPFEGTWNWSLLLSIDDLDTDLKGTDKERYKAHMKKKLLRENWENSLALYKAKEIEGDKFAMKSIVLRIRQDLAAAQEEAELPPSVPFPDEVPKLGDFQGEGQTEYKIYMQKKMMREIWENGLRRFRVKESERDKAGMAEIARSVYDELEELRKEIEIISAESGIDAEAVAENIELKILETQATTMLSSSTQDIPSEASRRTSDPPSNIASSSANASFPQSTTSASPSSSTDQPPNRQRRPTIGMNRSSSQTKLDLSGLTNLVDQDKVPQHQSGSMSARPAVRSTSNASSNPFDDADMTPNQRSGSLSARGPPTRSSSQSGLTLSNSRSNNENPFNDAVAPSSSTQPQLQRKLSIGNARLNSQGASPEPQPQSQPQITRKLSIGGSRVTAASPTSVPAGSQAHTLTGPFSLSTSLRGDRPHDLLYKVIIIGNSAVGKTNLLGRWIDDRFVETSATINVELGSRSFLVDDRVIKVQLWDTAGQEQYRAVTTHYYRGSKGALIVYDITSQASFDKVESWLRDVRDAPGNDNTQVLLIGNKIDLEKLREVPTDKGMALARKHGLYFMETSAKDGTGVHQAFQIILQEVHRIYNEIESQTKLAPVPSGKRTLVLSDDSNPPEEDNCPC